MFKKMKFKRKQIIPILVLIGLTIGMALFLYLNDVRNYQNTVKAMTFSEIDVSQIADGDYIGECNVNYIYAKVRVSVVDGSIKTIDLITHKNERGSAAERIVGDIVKEQKIDVNTISGATNSSKVIKKAVENALLGNVSN